MSDLPESVQRLHDEVVAHEWLNRPYRVQSGATSEQEALRAQQYAAAQAFHIRQALERIVGVLSQENKISGR